MIEQDETALKEQRIHRVIAVAAAGLLFGLAALIGIEVIWQGPAEETWEGQAVEVLGLAVTIFSLTTIVTGWQKLKR